MRCRILVFLKWINKDLRTARGTLLNVMRQCDLYTARGTLLNVMRQCDLHTARGTLLNVMRQCGREGSGGENGSVSLCICVCISLSLSLSNAESLCCSPETLTTLFVKSLVIKRTCLPMQETQDMWV